MQPTNYALARNTQSSLLAESLAAYARDVRAMQQLYRVAERHGRLPRDSPVARELVDTLIGDVFTRDAKCDPERTLGPQLERLVMRRANRLYKSDRPRRRRRGAPQPVFTPLEKAPIGALAVAPPQVALEHDEPTLEADEVVSLIRQLARDDDAALQLLALYAKEVVARRDVLATGMTDWVYRAAHERLVRYAAIAAGEPLPEAPDAPSPPEAPSPSDEAAPDPDLVAASVAGLALESHRSGALADAMGGRRSHRSGSACVQASASIAQRAVRAHVRGSCARPTTTAARSGASSVACRGVTPTVSGRSRGRCHSTSHRSG